MSFRLNATYLFLTYPQQNATAEALLDFLKTKIKTITFARIAEEVHEDGSPHLHAFLQLSKRCDIKAPRYLDFNGKHGDYQLARDPDKSLEYLSGMIDGLIKPGWLRKLDWGDYSSPAFRKKQAEIVAQTYRKERNALLLTKKPKDLVDEGSINLFDLPKLMIARSEYLKLTLPPVFLQRTCYWFYGQPGVGKSFYARSLEKTPIYIKDLTKWWDCYLDQTAVLIDDFEEKPSNDLAHFLKIWADSYRFQGEVKGGYVYPTYTTLYVTSNYLPQHIWENQPQIYLAISRRFQIYVFEKENDVRTKRLLGSDDSVII